MQQNGAQSNWLDAGTGAIANHVGRNDEYHVSLSLIGASRHSTTNVAQGNGIRRPEFSAQSDLTFGRQLPILALHRSRRHNDGEQTVLNGGSYLLLLRLAARYKCQYCLCEEPQAL